MLFPTPLLIGLSSVLALLALLSSLSGLLMETWTVLAGLAAGIALVDGWQSRRTPAVNLIRKVHSYLPVAAWSRVQIKLVSRAEQRLHIRFHDHCNWRLSTRDQPVDLTLSAGQSATLEYEIFPGKRGQYHFPGADLIVTSPLRLWQKKSFLACTSDVRVFPNFREIAHFTILATHHHLSMMGIKKLVKRGEGNEFHQLREYRQGDELQKIDWKATSRYRRLISKDYQDERDQQIVFVLDSGRRMQHVENDRSLLDQALNSILLLAYVASRQGDGVGLYCFGGTRKWLPPRKQEDSVRSLLLGMYDIQSSTQAADYIQAAEDLLASQKRRSLMVIITNSRAEDNDDLIRMARQLRRKHLVVIADLREESLDRSLTESIDSFDSALRFHGLLHYLEERSLLLRNLDHLGVLSLDVTAAQLPGAIVNTYLDIKGSSRL